MDLVVVYLLAQGIPLRQRLCPSFALFAIFMVVTGSEIQTMTSSLSDLGRIEF